MKRFLKPIQKYGLFKNIKGDVAYPGFTITVINASKHHPPVIFQS